MKYKTESFTDRAELYKWASEKKDIEYEGEIYGYGDDVNGGYIIGFGDNLYLYKKVIYIKTKKVEFWVNFYSDDSIDGHCTHISFAKRIDADHHALCNKESFIKTEKYETEIEVIE